MFLEVACFSKESAVIAEKAGADRIEFCAEMNLGGITPPLEDFLELKSLVQIPVFVMIRPNQIESESCNQLLTLAESIPCTFHRAFDCISDKEAAMETLIDLGFRTVLSSGGESAAIENLSVLARLQQKYGQHVRY